MSSEETLSELSMPLTPWHWIMLSPCAPYGAVCWDPWKLELVHSVELHARNTWDQPCFLLISSWEEFKVLVGTYKAPNGYPGGCFPSCSAALVSGISQRHPTLALEFTSHIHPPGLGSVQTWCVLQAQPGVPGHLVGDGMRYWEFAFSWGWCVILPTGEYFLVFCLLSLCIRENSIFLFEMEP